ncbi:peroxiredoxin-like family protein [Thermomonospora catenispora]|uniref:peroxiredoxin-like family protein n=1 Tax=Thermomonospora catenispora TaxID=2493090 RepID=UPI00111E3F32|nr:peroxiredoxin-like family protein [Thermomonospora catenispora]TNY37079.1 AhpC/TSA family protein [Thermomonospora catenispora]
MPTRSPARPITPGAVVPARELVAVDGERVPVPDPDGPVHLQFRRFAGCPVCSLHLRPIARRHAEIAAAGVREAAVFHSSAEELRPHVAHLPFPVIADPDKRLYAEFGVESAKRSLLDPRAWRHIVTAVTTALVRRDRTPPPRPRGGRFGLPADFLIGPDGRVLAVKYGEHVYDQWSVEEILHLARTAVSAGTSPAAPAPDSV